jgi:hypothetical protein
VEVPPAWFVQHHKKPEPLRFSCPSAAANPAAAKLIAGRFVPTTIVQVRSDCIGFFPFCSFDLFFHQEHLFFNFNH